MKRAIVTGATGFIGSAFVEHLSGNGVAVLALGRKPFATLPATKKRSLAGAAYLEMDMREISNLDERIAELQWYVGDECIFFNLAWGGVDRLSDMDIKAQLNNVVWSSDALEVAAKIGCSRFIQMGTMEEAFTYKYLELDHNVNSQYNRHVIYSVAKIAAKRALKIKASKLEIDFIYVLHSHVMGAGDNKDSFLQVTLQKLVRGEELIFSSGEQIFDVVSLEDCVQGYFLICKYGVAGAEYWVGSGEPRRLREYVEIMYQMFPSGKEMCFGCLPYNDVLLKREDFSINLLVEHTGYAPALSYEQAVQKLYASLYSQPVPTNP